MSQIWMGNADLIGCKMGIVKTQILNMRKNTKKKGICIVFSFSKNLFFKDFQKNKMIVSPDGGGAGIHSVLGGGWSIVIPNRVQGRGGWSKEARTWEEVGVVQPVRTPTLLPCNANFTCNFSYMYHIRSIDFYHIYC
jgi:hypothetical protein